MASHQIGLLLCEHFKKESETFLETERVDNIAFAYYPARCCQWPLQYDELIALISGAFGHCESIIIIGGCCIEAIQERVKALKQCSLYRFESCFYMFAGQTLIDHFFKNNALVLTFGLIENWLNLPQLYYKSPKKNCYLSHINRSKVIVLDTGVYDNADFKLKQFSDFIHKPFEIIPVGLDFFNLFLTNIIRQFQHQIEKTKLSEALDITNKQLYEQIMALDLLGKLTQIIKEDDVIYNMFNIFEMLLGTKQLFYLPLRQGKPQTLIVKSESHYEEHSVQEIMTLFSNKPSVWLEHQDGFLLRLIHREETVGIIYATQFNFPEYKLYYLNLAISIADICGLAIGNARVYYGILQAEKRQTLINHILKIFYIEQDIQVNLEDILAFIKDSFNLNSVELYLIETQDIAELKYRIYDNLSQECDSWIKVIAQQIGLSESGILNNLFIDNDDYIFFVSILTRQRCFGMLSLKTNNKEMFSSELILFLENLGATIALGMERHEIDSELRKQKERLANAQQIAHLGNWEWFIKKDLAVFSEEAYRILGLNANAPVTLKKFLAIVHRDDRKKVIAALKSALYQNNSYDIVYRIVLADNKDRIAQARATVIFDADGQPSRMLGTIHDITQLAKAEAELKQRRDHLEEMVAERTRQLRENEELLRLLIDTAGGVIVFLSLDKKVVHFNQQAERIYGVGKNDIIGKDGAQLFPWLNERSKAGDTQLQQVLNGYSIRNYEETIQSRHGQTYNLAWNIDRIHNAEWIPIGVIMIGQNITERKIMEESLRQSEQNLRALMDAITESVLMIDIHGTLLAVNETAATRLGKSVHNLIGSNVFNHIPPDIGAARKAKINLAIQEGKAIQFEDKRDAYYFSNHIYPMFDKNGKVERFAIFGRNITKRKTTEERLKTSLHEKDALLQEIHHRVKNNMQVITSLIGLQMLYVDNPAYVEMFKETQLRIKSMALVHEKLYRSQGLAQINFNDYVLDLTNDLLMSFGSFAENIAMKVHIIEDIFLSIDHAIPCGLIINELITNALKHAFPCERSGEIRIEMFTDKTKELTLIVADNGVGFPENIDFKNTVSLGLHIVVTLVKQLKGKIDLNRQCGALFKITFKRGRDAEYKES